MHKYFLIAGAICIATISPTFAISVAPIAGVTKCVQLSHSTTCVAEQQESTSKVDWSVTCGTKNISVIGISMCALSSGSAGTASTSLLRGNENNNNCWCKMVSPAVSRWISSGLSSVACGRDCAGSCRRALEDNYTFRSEMFRYLSD